MIDIMFDHRDTAKKTGRHPWAEQAREQLPLENVEIFSLSLGDIQWKGFNDFPNLAEIKHIQDGVESLKNGRLQDEMARLMDWKTNQDNGGAIYLFVIGRYNFDVEGNLCYSMSDWEVPNFTDNPIASFNEANTSSTVTFPVWEPAFRPYAWWVSYLASIKSLGIEVVEMIPPNGFGKVFSTVFRRSQKDRHHIPARRIISILDRDIQALMCIAPALKRPSAESLLQEFGSIQSVLNQDISYLTSVKGIGIKSAEQVYYNARKRN